MQPRIACMGDDIPGQLDVAKGVPSGAGLTAGMFIRHLDSPSQPPVGVAREREFITKVCFVDPAKAGPGAKTQPVGRSRGIHRYAARLR